jgi:cell division initiation protein
MFEQDKTPPAPPALPVRFDRIVRNTPLDLRQRRFSTAMRGFDRHEVVTFLSDVANDYEQVLQQLDLSQQELLRLEGLIHEHRMREDNLRNTLMTAQKLADQIREAAQHEAQVIVREAEARADLVLDKANARVEEVEREINELRLRRRSVEGGIEASIAALQHALEFIRGQDSRDDRILLHRPRQAGEAGSPAAARPAEPAAGTADRRAEPEV